MPQQRPSPCPNSEPHHPGKPATAAAGVAGRRGWLQTLWVAVGTASTGLTQAGTASTPQAADTPAGQWWFALAALAGLAAAGYALGRLTERRRWAAALFETRSQHQALLASMPDTVWRTDAQHRFVASDAVPPQPAAAPPWSGHPAWAQLLQARRSFANVALPATGGTDAVSRTTPAQAAALPARAPLNDSPAPGWLLSGQPVLDVEGSFAGFVGTARVAAEAESTALRALAGIAGAAMDGGAAEPLNTALLGGVGGGQAGLSGASPESHATAATAKAAEATAASTAANAAALAAAQAESDEAYNFSYTVAHDLRAPIRVVDGFTRIVKEDYGPVLDRVANDHLERVLNAAARMNKMIDAMLTLARLSHQPLTRQPVNLSQIARYVVDELQRTQPAREVEVHIEEGLLVTGDPTLLRLALENLLGNAWKYSSRTAQAQISLTSTPHGSGRAFVVRDNGVGFDMRTADRLFGVFQRLHSASEFPGHGVGLTSTRRIVRRHGGEIWAESEPARGAAFSFTLAEG